MYWEVIAPMVVAIALILTVGGVLILRPIAKRLSELVELFARDRREGVAGEVHQLRELMETIDARLQLIEERQDFTERLLGSGSGSIPIERAATRTDLKEPTAEA